MSNVQRSPTAKWCGIVMLIRCDLTKLSEGEVAMCRVVSKKDPKLNYRRAVADEVPYAPLARWFNSDDGDAVEVYAEVLSNGEGSHHLEIYERASKRDFFLHEPQESSTPAH